MQVLALRLRIQRTRFQCIKPHLTCTVVIFQVIIIFILRFKKYENVFVYVESYTCNHLPAILCVSF